MSTLKKNLGYQTLYQILNTSVPLITSPYLSRVLGAEKQGIFSYTQSIVNFFVLFAMLGVVNYGTRAIADCGGDKKKRSITFWNIYIFQMCCSGFLTSMYMMYISKICSQYKFVSFLQIFYLLGAFTDINWLFFGMEKFKITVKRNIFIRISSVILIMILVKESSDLWIYTFIMSGSIFCSNAVLWIFAIKEIEIVAIKRISIIGIIRHVKPNLVLFAPLIAMSVYHIMDKTMLGVLSNYQQVGFYYNADKIINIPMGILTGVGTVMLPRMTSLYKKEKTSEANNLFLLSIEIIVFVSVAISCGIAAISNEFTPFFFGKGYDPCIRLIILLSPVLIIKGLSEIARMQYLIPNHKENIFIGAVICGAIVNFILNVFLISKMGAIGAVIGTVGAEVVSCVFQYVKMNKYVFCLHTVSKSMVYVVFGIVMFVGVRMVAGCLNGGIVAIFFEILVGTIIYMLECLIYWRISKNEILDMIRS